METSGSGLGMEGDIFFGKIGSGGTRDRCRTQTQNLFALELK